MKFFATFALLALFAVAFAQSQEVEPDVQKKVEAAPVGVNSEANPDPARDKRGLLVGATYSAPITYTSYSAPYVYSAPYAYPYAYHYRSYPYAYNHYY